MSEVVVLVSRPPQLPAEVSDAVLLQAVREFMFGADHPTVATLLSVTVQSLHSMVRTTQWAVLQNQFRDEFINTEGARMVRLQRKLMDRLEDYLDTGITCYGQDKLGTTFEYHRELSPKEAVSIALMLNDTNKRLDRVREGDVDRKTFDGRAIIQDLESRAKFAREREIDGQSIREVG